MIPMAAYPWFTAFSERVSIPYKFGASSPVGHFARCRRVRTIEECSRVGHVGRGDT